jgi:hypothetical protein
MITQHLESLTGKLGIERPLANVSVHDAAGQK